MLKFSNVNQAIQYLSDYTGSRVKIAKYNGSRIHMSPKEIKKVNSSSQRPKPFFKPNGFWYSCGSDWKEWVESEMPSRLYDHLYEVEINPSKILFIDNIDKFEGFEKEYGIWEWEPQQGRVDITGPDMIDWNKVSEKYSGIEICPYVGIKRMHSNWYYPWDIASGCVWDNSAIKDIKNIKEAKEDES